MKGACRCSNMANIPIPFIEKEDEVYLASLRCFRCGLCRTGCPVFEVQRSEDWNTRGRIALIRGLALGEVPPSPSLVDRIFSCTLCRRCEVLCPSKVNVSGLIHEARVRLVKAGVAPPTQQAIQRDNIVKWGVILDRQPAQTASLIGDVVKRLDQESSMVFHVGCVAAYSYPLIARACIETLRHYVSFRVRNVEKCCGGVLSMLGYDDDFRKIAEENVRLFGEEKVDEVFALCPMCYTAFKEEYPWSITVMHTSQLYAELLDAGKMSFSKRVDAVVAYHDPCHLGRYAGVYEPPRKTLESIPGVKLVELEDSRELSPCCGGPVRIPYSWIRDELSSKIIRLAAEVGAEYVATACPTCFHNLYSASMLSEYNVKAVMVDELVSFAAGVTSKIPLYEP